MRILNKTLLLSLVVAILNFACSKSSDPKKSTPSSPSVAAGVMTSTLSGTAWTFDQASAVIANGSITIVGTEGNVHITLNVPKATTVGTYTVTSSSSPSGIVSYNDGTGAAEYASVYYANGTETGSIEITAIDATAKTISGKFTSKVKRFSPTEAEVQITEGVFNKIPYSTTAPAVPDNTFSAKIDGATFTPDMIGGTSSLGTLMLNFTLSGTKTITVDLPYNVVNGTYAFGTIGDSYYATYTVSSNYYVSNSGSVSVTKHDVIAKRIEGTFSFTCEPFPLGGTAVSVTNGSFGVSY